MFRDRQTGTPEPKAGLLLVTVSLSLSAKTEDLCVISAGLMRSLNA